MFFRGCKCEVRGIFAAVAVSCLLGCGPDTPRSIAVIPRTSGTILWEPENVGAQTAAAELGERVYWNASTREDDIDGQISLVSRMRPDVFEGLVLAPDHALALITPVRRSLASGLPIVIVGSPLPIPASENLSYILNDEEEGGRLAAGRVAALVHSRGKIAVIGVDPDIAGILERSESFERHLAAAQPKVKIVVRRLGTFNYAHEQEAAEKVLREYPDLTVIVALSSTATRGAISAIESSPQGQTVKVIGFDPESLPFGNACLDSMVVENTRSMGDLAIRLLHARFEGVSFPPTIRVQPLLVTRDTVGSPALREMLYARWRPGGADLKRSAVP